jgi:hypothetical protein
MGGKRPPAKLLSFKDQWCATPIASLALTNVAADKDFSNVVFPTGFLPTGAIVQAIYLMVKWRKQVDSSAAPNAINGASKTIRVMKNGAVWGTNETYNVRSEQTNRTDALVVDGDALTLYDVYTGFRVYYTL